MTLHVFVGYDIREHAAWLACRETLLRPLSLNALQDVVVHPLNVRELRRQGLFTRPWRIDEKGQYWDERDERPFSTEFSHSRFLVPHLARELGLKGWAVFVDCDFMFQESITKIVDGLDPATAKMLYVVKHDFPMQNPTVKMDGMAQQSYFRKLWSSLMLFNLDHPDLDEFFRPEFVNKLPGSTLHGFMPLDDDDIGALDERWNWIPSHSDPTLRPKAVHWSFGGPWMEGYHDTPYAEQWRAIYDGVLHNEPCETTFPLV